MVNWLNLALPFAYMGILVGSLATFSSIYKKRKLARAGSLAPWFGPHTSRNIYLSLLHLETEPKIPDSVLKAALLRRATEDIHRIMSIRSQKQALSGLLQRGSVGDDLWQRFQRAEKEIEEELRDVVNEANAFAPGWGQAIFQTANEIANNTMLRKRLDELQGQMGSEKEWWDTRKAEIQSNFMKELDGDSTTAEKKSDDDAVLVEGGGPSSQAGGKKNKKKNKNRGD